MHPVGAAMPNDHDCAEISAAKDELLRTSTDVLAQKLKAMTAYGDMLVRHLAIQRDDIGSDYALAIRESIEELELFLTVVRPLTAKRDVDADEIREALEAVNRPSIRRRF